MSTYSVPRSAQSNCSKATSTYSVPKSCSCSADKKTAEEGGVGRKRSTILAEEHLYATPDDFTNSSSNISPDAIQLRSNNAYVSTSGTFTLKEGNFYSSVQSKEKDSCLQNKETLQQQDTYRTRHHHHRRRHYHHIHFCVGAAVFLSTVAMALGSTALAVIAHAGWPQHQQTSTAITTENAGYCNCSGEISSIEERLNRTYHSLKASQSDIDTLSLQLESLLAYVNASRESPTTTLPATTTPGQRMNSTGTGFLHNCSTRLEARCTVEPDAGQCATTTVPRSIPDTVTTELQCVRTESPEQNPMLAMLDITGNEATCLCFVIEIYDMERNHPVECILRATRCSVADNPREVY